MPSIKSTSLRDLKLRVSVADVVSRVVTLRKAGGTRLKGLCPFHNEKTPSFHVDPDKGLYHCFGCNKSGDIISFVRETEQLNFSEAVEALGKRFGVVIEYEEGSGGPSREERSLRQELFELHDLAAEHFHQAFKATDATGDFMRRLWTEKRRFSAELADEFKIGAADESGGGLGALLWKKKFSEEAMRRCGLFFIYDDAAFTLGALRPRFRGRLMIPIRDHQGRVVAFTARQTDLTPQDDPAREAKYVNSPETPIFTKGNLLFNLDRARTAVGDGKPFVLVEGQLDAMRCWSVGLKTAIAPQGTAITESQLVLLRRYHAQVECFFDSDSAGQKASQRFLPMALKAGLEVRFLTLAGNDKVDPDLLFLERGLAAYEEVRRGALGAMAFACRTLLPAAEAATPEQKAATARQLYEIISAAESEVARAGFIGEVAAYLRLPSAALSQDFQTFLQRLRRQAAARPAGPTPTAPTTVGGAPSMRAKATPEHHLLILTLHFETLGKPLSALIPADHVDIGHLAGRLLNRFLAHFQDGDWPGSAQLEDLLESEEERVFVAEVLFEDPKIDNPVRVADLAIAQLTKRSLEVERQQIQLAMASTTADSDSDFFRLQKRLLETRAILSNPPTLSAFLAAQAPA